MKIFVSNDNCKNSFALQIASVKIKNGNFRNGPFDNYPKDSYFQN